MAISEATSGTQTATLDTEHTLGTAQTDDASYLGRVNVTNMVAADVLKVRVYVKAVSAGALALWQEITLSGAQTEDVVDTDPCASVHSWELRIEQTDGIGRAFEWSILKAT